MIKYERKEIKALFLRAEAESFAVPAFNYSDQWDLRAIVEAAEEEEAPVLLMADPPVFEELGNEFTAAIADLATEKSDVPVIHHLDHASSIADCKRAIDLGFRSVMMDASNKPLDGNIDAVRDVTDYAHERGAFVEAEIGRIRGETGYETAYSGDDFLFKTDEAVALVQQANPDSLAIGIGNAHGFYVGKPELNFEKLQEAKAAISVPLVLHGGTGIPESDIRKAIKLGIRKINVGTAVYTAYMNGIRQQLIDGGENQWTLDVMKVGVERVKQVVKMWIRTCMANGKAR
jgi:ketose-bisphosphate aldolase